MFIYAPIIDFKFESVYSSLLANPSDYFSAEVCGLKNMERIEQEAWKIFSNIWDESIKLPM